MIYSASSVADYAKYGDSAYHLKKQLLFAGDRRDRALPGVVVGLPRRRKRGSMDIRRPEVVAWAVWGAVACSA